MVMTYVTRMSC